MNAYFRMFRMINCVMAVVGLVVAAFIAGGVDGLVGNPLSIAVLMAVVFLFVAGGNSLNDGIDYQDDLTAHPTRPVPMGEISPEAAKKTGFVLLALSFLISILTLNAETIILVGIAAVLMVAYETRAKQVGLPGNIIISVLTGMVFLVGSSAVGSWMDSIYLACMVAAVSLGREISKDIEDMESDKDRNTLPMRIGTRNSAIVAAVFFILGVALSIVPLALQQYSILYVSVILADIAFVKAAVDVFKDPHAAQHNAKIGMLLGLVAFILSAIYI